MNKLLAAFEAGIDLLLSKGEVVINSIATAITTATSLVPDFIANAKKEMGFLMPVLSKFGINNENLEAEIEKAIITPVASYDNPSYRVQKLAAGRFSGALPAPVQTESTGGKAKVVLLLGLLVAGCIALYKMKNPILERIVQGMRFIGLDSLADSIANLSDLDDANDEGKRAIRREDAEFLEFVDKVHDKLGYAAKLFDLSEYEVAKFILYLKELDAKELQRYCSIKEHAYALVAK